MKTAEAMREIEKIKEIRDEKRDLENYVFQNVLSVEQQERFCEHFVWMDDMLESAVKKASSKHGISEEEIWNLIW